MTTMIHSDDNRRGSPCCSSPSPPPSCGSIAPPSCRSVGQQCRGCGFWSWLVNSFSRCSINIQWKSSLRIRPFWSSPRFSSEKAKTIFKVSNTWIRKGIPVQCLRLQTKKMGTGEEFEPDGTSSKDLVSKSSNEVKEDKPKSSRTKQVKIAAPNSVI